MTHFDQLFTSRPLVALTTFSDLVAEAMERVKRDAANADLPNDRRLLRDEGWGLQRMLRQWGCIWLCD